MTDRAGEPADVQAQRKEMQGRKIDAEEIAATRRSYLIGLVLSVVLTVPAFLVVMADWASGWTARAIIYGLGVIQIAVHLRYFLHLDIRGSRREDLLVLLFTLLLAAMMVGGTLWIVLGMNTRMMAPGVMDGSMTMPPAAM